MRLKNSLRYLGSVEDGHGREVISGVRVPRRNALREMLDLMACACAVASNVRTLYNRIWSNGKYASSSNTRPSKRRVVVGRF